MKVSLKNCKYHLKCLFLQYYQIFQLHLTGCKHFCNTVQLALEHCTTCRKYLLPVKQCCREDCPEKQNIDDRLKSFWFMWSELSVYNNLFLCGSRIVILEFLQQEVLGQLHEASHDQGRVKYQNNICLVSRHI